MIRDLDITSFTPYRSGNIKGLRLGIGNEKDSSRLSSGFYILLYILYILYNLLLINSKFTQSNGVKYQKIDQLHEVQHPHIYNNFQCSYMLLSNE